MKLKYAGKLDALCAKQHTAAEKLKELEEANSDEQMYSLAATIDDLSFFCGMALVTRLKSILG